MKRNYQSWADNCPSAKSNLLDLIYKERHESSENSSIIEDSDMIDADGDKIVGTCEEEAGALATTQTSFSK